MQDKKFFPIRLPEDYHGKPREKMPTIHRKKVQFWQNPEIGNIKPSRWQKKSIDANVIKQRKQMIVSSSKVSQQAPDWLKTTFHHYYRNSAPKRPKQSPFQQSKYDIFNQQRTISFSNNYGNQKRKQKQFESSSISNRSQQFMKTGFPAGYSGMRFNSIEIGEKQISPKIGSLDTRDYTIRKPLLKIGKQSYVDTYSPF